MSLTGRETKIPFPVISPGLGGLSMSILSPVGPPSFAHGPADLILTAVVLVVFAWPAAILIKNLRRSK